MQRTATQLTATQQTATQHDSLQKHTATHLFAELMQFPSHFAQFEHDSLHIAIRL